MFCKLVKLNIFSSNTPYELTILAQNGQIIKQITIETNKSKICFHTKNCTIKLFARYNNETNYQTAHLSNRLCQSCNVSFAFQSILRPIRPNIIKLSDATYGFPIAKAILNFRQI